MKIQQKINNNFIKLDQLLKLVGIAQTGGQAKIIISDEDVYLNGEICKIKGKKIHNKDVVSYKDYFIEVIANGE